MCEVVCMSENHQDQAGVAETETAETPKPIEDSRLASAVTVNGFKIEVGIPVPDFQAGRAIGSKFDPVFAEMPVGGSILFSGDRAEREVGSLQRVAKKRGLRFITRKVTEDGVAGIRVWRRDGK